VIEVPHEDLEFGTKVEGVRLFRALAARALLVNKGANTFNVPGYAAYRFYDTVTGRWPSLSSSSRSVGACSTAMKPVRPLMVPAGQSLKSRPFV
jgi:hypothetical protein